MGKAAGVLFTGVIIVAALYWTWAPTFWLVYHHPVLMTVLAFGLPVILTLYSRITSYVARRRHPSRMTTGAPEHIAR